MMKNAVVAAVVAGVVAVLAGCCSCKAPSKACCANCGLLAADPEAVVSRETLMNEAWGLDYYGTTRTVDQTVANLRKKQGPGLDIQSVRGEGYRLVSA